MVAIYTRQSLEKIDSISLDTQAKYCSDICDKNNWKYKIYSDSGFSGKDIDRPSFKSLLNDINNNKIDKVIAYRLDRISRNIVDFANLLQLFQKNNVDFISATESFDTTSPIGRAMIYIIMTFAQLERETIVSRVTDNYYARAKKGVFTGGNIPYGYTTKKEFIDGKNASVFVPEGNEVYNIFYDYLILNKTIRSIAFARKLIPKNIRRMLSNPFYAKADALLYSYLKSKDYIINNSIDDFTGKFGVQVFGKERGRKNRIKTELNEQIVVIGRHKPVIDSEMFIATQEKLSKIKIAPTGKTGKYSWLTGIIKCDICGHSIGIKAKGNYKYAVCSKHRLYNNCENKTFYKLDELEKTIQNEIKNDLLNIKLKKPKQREDNNQILLDIARIDDQINVMVENISKGTVLSEALELKAKKLVDQKKELEQKLFKREIQNKNIILENIEQYQKEYIENFNNLDLENKRKLIRIIVNKITLNNSKINIFYNF